MSESRGRKVSARARGERIGGPSDESRRLATCGISLQRGRCRVDGRSVTYYDAAGSPPTTRGPARRPTEVGQRTNGRRNEQRSGCRPPAAWGGPAIGHVRGVGMDAPPNPPVAQPGRARLAKPVGPGSPRAATGRRIGSNGSTRMARKRVVIVGLTRMGQGGDWAP